MVSFLLAGPASMISAPAFASGLVGSLGIHSRELCRSYVSAQAAAGSVLSETGQTIVDNMSCTERWEQQGNDPHTRVYVGCW